MPLGAGPPRSFAGGILGCPLGVVGLVGSIASAYSAVEIVLTILRTQWRLSKAVPMLERRGRLAVEAGVAT